MLRDSRQKAVLKMKRTTGSSRVQTKTNAWLITKVDREVALNDRRADCPSGVRSDGCGAVSGGCMEQGWCDDLDAGRAECSPCRPNC